LNLKITRHLT